MRSRTAVATTWVLALALAALSISCGNDNAKLRFANLDGADETPPNSSTATGTAAYKIPNSRNSIQFSLTVENIENVVAAHIHVGAPGVPGAIIFPLANGPFTTLTGTLTEADFTPAPAAGINTFADGVNALLAGNTYTNVHTTAFPAGEIRGQNE